MKKWFKENVALIIGMAVFLAIIVGVGALSVFWVKSIAESDLPDWLKLWLVMG